MLNYFPINTIKKQANKVSTQYNSVLINAANVDLNTQQVSAITSASYVNSNIAKKFAKIAKTEAAKINEETYDKTYLKLKKVRQKQALAKNLAMSAAKQAILELKAALGQ